MKTTIKCPHAKQQYLIGGGRETFCDRDGRIVTISQCLACKEANAKERKSL